ncbi:hypothetical protein FIBSPDRAFT_853982 [Athelia psychrophila]|uniref:Uncharacterized protein n=1 Tax=Athelia psychrophila TaxID=1759441 RepID=A0A166QIY3_9AGAM|nr:hypothetical protein FIBSPDRAFT_853982 [Fibularhizoctonia sp. CBS 109695]
MLIDWDRPFPRCARLSNHTQITSNVRATCSSLSQLESAFPSVLSSSTPYSSSVISDTCSCSLLTIYTSSLP